MNYRLLIPRGVYRSFGRCAGWLFVHLSLLLLFVAGSSPPLFGQTLPQNEACTDVQDNPAPLAPGEVLGRPMKANQRHIFRIKLMQQQYARVTVDQKGVDVVIKLFDPNHSGLVERDSPNGKFGPEAISIIAQLTGTYYVEVCASKTQPVGSYELKLEGPQSSNAADAKRIMAEGMLMQGHELLQQQTTDARALAIKQFESARQLFKELADAREEGYALCNTAEIFRALKNFPKAMKHLDQALSRLTEAQDVSGQAYVLNEMGAAYRELDVRRKALEKYARAIELRRSIGDRWGEAQLLNNIGLVYSLIGEQQNSIASSELALALWRDLNDRANEMNTLNNIAKANVDLGNFSVAFQQLQEVLKYCAEGKAVWRLEPSARNSLGIIHDTWGTPNEALTQYELALKVFREKGDKKNEANTLNNAGMVFAGLNDADSALDKFQEALTIGSQNVGSQTASFGEEAVTRSNIGYAQMLLGNYPAALKELDQAQRLSRASEDPRFEAFTLTRMGMAYVAMTQWDQAIASYNHALEIQNRIEDSRGQAITLDKIGEFYSLVNQPALALKNYRQALEGWRSVSDAQGEAVSLYGIARVERNQNHFTEARDRVMEAIAKVESLRTKMTSHRLRMIYYEARQDFFELEIDVRMRLYYATRSTTELESALFASERARARNLLDLLAESRVDIRQGVSPNLLERERTQRTLLTEKLTQFQRLSSGKFTAAQRNAADNEIKELTREHDQTQSEIRKQSPRYAALTQPQPLRPAQIQQLLDEDTILLQYALGEKRSYLWVVTPTDILPYVLPGEAQIKKAAERFRTSLRAWEKRESDDAPRYVARLQNAPANYRKEALKLSNIVLAPGRSKIGNKRLVIIADGELQYVPFGALLVRNEMRPLAPVPLIVNHEIVYQPSASALALIREAPRTDATKTVAVLADPVFSKTDNRVAALKDSKTEPNVVASSRELKRALRDAGDTASVDGSFRLDRLDYSRGEADAIIAAAPPRSSLKALDFDASRAHVLSPELKQFRIVHLATHGILNGNHPELSGLVFSLVDERGQPEDGFLKLSDIYNMDLPLDMIVLSACQSGVGKRVRGEGLVGLTRGFMHAGAARVVASLWNVQDEATAELMKRFYHYLLQKNMPAAAALRRAQLDLMEARGATNPYYWAGFVLQGEWK